MNFPIEEKIRSLSLTSGRLPSLAEAVDPVASGRAFQDLFDREYAGRGLEVEDCRLDRIYVKPGRKCWITYRVRGRDQAGRPFDQWFHAKMLARREEHTPRPERTPRTGPGSGFWKPISEWPERGMVLHAFPHDPQMPRLPSISLPP